MKTLLLTFCLAASATPWRVSAQDSPPASSQDSAAEPARRYADAYQNLTKAAELRKGGNLQAAYQLYTECVKAYESLGKEFPEWNAEMLKYRLEATKKELMKLDEDMKEQGIAPPVEGEAPPLAENIDGEMVRRPVEGDIIPPDAAVPGLPPIDDYLKALDYLRAEYQTMREAYGSLFHESSDLKGRFEDLEKNYQQVFGRVALAEEKVKLTEQKLAEVEAKSGTDAEKAAADLAAVKSEWEAIKKDLDTAVAEKEKLLADMPDLAKKYDAQLKEIADLKKELDDARKREADMDAAAGDGGMKALVDAKNKLENDLSAANEKIKELTAAGVAKDKEITSLKSDLEKAAKEIAQLKDEGHKSTMKVATLTDDLRVARADLEKLKSDKSADPILQQENQVLQEYIVSEIRRQSRIQESKSILMQELTKVQGINDELMEKLRVVTENISVPKEVRQALRLPEDDEIFQGASSESGISTTLVARRDQGSGAETTAPASATPSGELVAKARAAYDAGEYGEAEKAYLDYLRSDPKNSQILANLGAVQARLQKNADAEVHLKKAIAHDEKNAFAHFMLGVLKFSESKLKEADEELTAAVKLDPSNAKAHHYLGIIASKSSDYQRAESELATAVSLDQDYTSAHFNLAVLYATMPERNWEKSRQHYLTAIEKGAKRDKELETLLEKQFPGFAETIPAGVTTANP